MNWIIQKGFNEDRMDEFIRILDVAGENYSVVKVVPFSHEIVPKLEIQNPIIVFGATTLVKIAKSYGWGPGVWWNENFLYENYIEHWGNHLLNNDAKISRFGDLHLTEPTFIRSNDDCKLIAGMVVHPDKFNEWKESITRYNDMMVNSDTMVVTAKPKYIMSEYRCFIVDGKVVTSSQYKIGNRVQYLSNLDDEIERFAQQRVDEWSPTDSFVMDVAKTEDGLKILEINNLNSSGFYQINLHKLVFAIKRKY